MEVTLGRKKLMNRTDTILKIRNFVKNGGRLRKNEEPRYGEPFYGEYTRKKIESDYQPGDMVQITTNDKISIGIFLEISGGNVNLLIKGKKVWNSGKNVEKCWIKDIKFMYLLEAKEDAFDMDEVDPLNRYHMGHDYVENDNWCKKPNLERRNRDQQQFTKVYPDVDFCNSHIINVPYGCTLYWPFHNEGITAEIYLVYGDGSKVINIPCTVKTPFSNKNSYHAFNYKNPQCDTCYLYTYLPDCHKEYQNINLVCIWKIKTTIRGSLAEIKVIHINHIEKIEPVEDDRNLHFTDMRTTTLVGYGEELFSNHQWVLEKLMNFDSMFLLESEEDAIIPIKESNNDFTYGLLAHLVYHGFHMQKLLETICSENQSTLPVEVYVDKNEVLDGYYSSSWRKCRKEYKFQLLK